MAFILGFPTSLYLASRETIWALAAAIYVYYAAPTREFQAPGLPYQPFFFGLTILLSVRYSRDHRKRARETLEALGKSVGRAALEKVREPMMHGYVNAIVRGASMGEARHVALLEVEKQALDEVEETSPRALTASVQKAVRSALAAALETMGQETQRALETARGVAAGALRASLIARVVPLATESLHKELDSRVDSSLDRLIREDAEQRKVQSKDNQTGPLGMPLPRGVFAAVLSSSGLWLFSIFAILTIVGWNYAKHDQFMAWAAVNRVILLYIPLIAIIAGTRTERHFRIFSWAWMFGCWHIAMNGVKYWASFGGRADDVGGPGGDANALGAVCASMIPMGLSIFLSEKDKRLRWSAAGMSGFMGLGILASGSRGALVAVAVGMAYWMISTSRKALAGGLLTLALGGFLVVAPETFWERLASTISASSDNPWVAREVELSAQERIELWTLAIEVFKENPWTGVGPYNYVVESRERTMITDAYFGARGMMTHNSWLQILSEYGIIGFSVWVFGFCYSLWCFFRARTRLRDYPNFAWFKGYAVGHEAGMIGTAIAITFASFQWFDYLYWGWIVGPLYLQITGELIEREKWLEPRKETVDRLPPKYPPPQHQGLRLDLVDLRATPVVSSEGR